MAFVSDSNTQNAPSEEEHAEAAAATSRDRAFDMVSLRAHLPQKRRGLSTYFSGQSRSFTCLGDAKSVGDLEKAAPEIPEAKRRKYMDRRRAVVLDCGAPGGSGTIRGRWRAAAPGASDCGACVGV